MNEPKRYAISDMEPINLRILGLLFQMIKTMEEKGLITTREKHEMIEKGLKLAVTTEMFGDLF